MTRDASTQLELDLFTSLGSAAEKVVVQLKRPDPSLAGETTGRSEPQSPPMPHCQLEGLRALYDPETCLAALKATFKKPRGAPKIAPTKRRRN